MLRLRYGIEVLSPSAFQILGEIDPELGAITASTRDTLELKELTCGNEVAVRELLARLGVALVDQSTAWAADDGNSRARHRYIVRSEEHTSELQSPCNLVCRLLLEKKNTV